ncbi:hypothetical protein BDN70DRAFT_938489 [Pholiota conissans]|uniref:WSC domain-containing protein n=1 Tax=Pholiota conissans TaxID=109636 RepID=A0A9P5YQW0_9AGAR|nr:hypothetical protein BDN70DRAFT_938489 [Pholiota conissans]
MNPIAFLLLGSLLAIPTLSQTYHLQGNTSVLPSGWALDSVLTCVADCVPDDEPIASEFLFGPSFIDPVGLTIESCVAFCDAQGTRLAGLKGTECRCSNVFNPSSCFESDGGECNTVGFDFPCPGNPVESCGLADGTPPLFNLYKNSISQFNCSDTIWSGGAALTAGKWRFSNFYNDSINRALPHNAVNLHVPLPRGNLTTAACTTACGNAGWLLAGVEFADECYCGNATQNNAQPISTNCAGLPQNNFFPVPPVTLKRCKGNANEFCGGPNIVSIYTLPGSGLVPMVDFNPGFDGFCDGRDCLGNT